MRSVCPPVMATSSGLRSSPKNGATTLREADRWSPRAGAKAASRNSTGTGIQLALAQVKGKVCDQRSEQDLDPQVRGENCPSCCAVGDPYVANQHRRGVL